MEFEKLLVELQQQEAEIQFTSFNHELALQVGLTIAEEATNRDKAVSIHIERNGRVLFHYAMQGTSPDNDQWIRRKCNVVTRFEMSSFRMKITCKHRERTIEFYQTPQSEYAPFGGAFPITIRNVGVVGVVAISGLPDKEDHQLVIDTLRKFLN